MYVHIYLTVICWACGFTKTVGQGSPLILTPYVERGEAEKAKNLSRVDSSYFAGVNSHAAYFTVNKTNKWHLYFWYFPAEGVPIETTPIIIWLQGGPGASSLFGLFEEIGPIQYKNGKVERRPITWGTNYSLIFIENPVGTGFSFTETDKYVTNEDMVGACLLSFLQQFLQVFPELKSAPLFLAGESYAGKFVTAFGHYIHHNKNDSLPINLKGLAISHGFMDPPTMMHYSEFALQAGLVDPEKAAEIHQIEEEAIKAWEDHDMATFAKKARGALIHLLEQIQFISTYNYNKDGNQYVRFEYENYLNNKEVQNVLHTSTMFYDKFNNDVYSNLENEMYDTVKPWLEELIEHYGVMCYSGQLDVISAYAVLVQTYRSLKWSGREAYLNATRVPIYDSIYDWKINFFVKASGNFMDVMVRNAGHLLPIDQPRSTKQVMDMFIQKFK